MLDKLQALITGVVLLLFHLGRGAHGVFIAIFLAVPVLRLVFSGEYRKRTRLKFETYWRELQNYPQRKVPWKALFWIILFPGLAIFLANGIGISSNDNYPVIMSTASLLNDRDLELSEYTDVPLSTGREICKEKYSAPYYFHCTPNGVRSAYPLGMMLPLLPFFAVLKGFGQDPANADYQWRLTKWASSLMAAFSLALFFLLARHYVSFPAALFVTYFLMFGSAFTSIMSQGNWSHGGVILGTLLILYADLRHEDLTRSSRTIFYAFLCAWIFSCRLNSISILIPLSLYLAVRRGLLFSFVMGITAILFYAPLAFYYYTIYSNPFGPQMVMWTHHQNPMPLSSALLGILFSPTHGTLPYQPWVALIFLYVFSSVRNLRKERIEKSTFLFWVACVVFHIFIIARWPAWWGGTWGSRLMSEVIPFLGFLVLVPTQFILVKFQGAGRRALVGLVVFSFLFHLPFLFLWAGFNGAKPLVGDLEGEARLWDWKSPPFLWPVLKLVRPFKPLPPSS